MSADPSGLASADPTNPQSLNLYAYVLNNPLRFLDPTGLECTGTEVTGNSESYQASGELGATYNPTPACISFAAAAEANPCGSLATLGQDGKCYLPPVYYPDPHLNGLTTLMLAQPGNGLDGSKPRVPTNLAKPTPNTGVSVQAPASSPHGNGKYSDYLLCVAAHVGVYLNPEDYLNTSNIDALNKSRGRRSGVGLVPLFVTGVLAFRNNGGGVVATIGLGALEVAAATYVNGVCTASVY